MFQITEALSHNGIRIYDTSEFYGNGYAETILGTYILQIIGQENPIKLFLKSKVIEVQIKLNIICGSLLKD